MSHPHEHAPDRNVTSQERNSYRDAGFFVREALFDAAELQQLRDAVERVHRQIDAAAAGRLTEVFAELLGQGRTLVVVSHDEMLIERADQVLALHEGTLESSP